MLMAGLVFSFASVIRAEDGDDKPDFREVRKENRDSFKNEMESNREAMKAEFEAKREAFRKATEDSRKAFMEEQKKEREAFMAELKAKKEEFKNASEERKAEFKGNAKKMIGERFVVAVRNLERFQERVQAIINNIDGDTAPATEYLNASKTKLTAAVVIIEEIKTLIPDENGKVDPATFEMIKSKAREAKELLKASKKDLQDSIRALKILKGEGEDSDENNEDENSSDDSSADNSTPETN